MNKYKVSTLIYHIKKMRFVFAKKLKIKSGKNCNFMNIFSLNLFNLFFDFLFLCYNKL